MPARISDTAIALGVRVARYRKRKEMSQGALGEKCGVSQVHIADIEHGRRQPSIELLKKLCVALEVSADQLLGLDDSQLEAPARVA
jgi:transcriptional regulator with XRE-family HTH domain